MYALLLDSSNTALSVGLAKDHHLIDEISYEAWQKQSEYMVAEIDKILKKNKVDRKDIAFVAVTKGPGSYTGIRIALTIAKTIVFALNIPLYLVSSLEMMKIKGKATICLTNARSQRSYIGVYEDDKEILSDRIMDNPQVIAYAKEHPDYVLSGELGYLGLQGQAVDVLHNLNEADTAKNLCAEPLGARPVYLKDSYSDSEIKIIVRKMNSSDMSSVMRIEDAAFKNPYTEKQMKYELMENPVATILVAVVDSNVVGFIDFMITFDSATINQIAVDEKFRKRGVGTQLIGAMVKTCQAQEDEVDFVTLEVRNSNTNAQRFYKKHAFEVITTKPKYYDDGEDAIYMVRSIIND
jgi:ribosomal-protein-alanine acetyltransferase